MNQEAILAAAMSLSAAHAERVEDVRPVVDLRAGLHESQQRAWDDPSPTVAILAGRRGGKTWWDAAWLLEGGLEPGALCVYLALTSKSARHIVWPVLKQVCVQAGIRAHFNEHTLTVTVASGGTIVVAGTDDSRTIETWRGVKLSRAVVDECGSQPPFLAYLYRDILKPACLDLRGRLAFSGTPSPLMDGFWFEMSGPADVRKMRVPVHHWTVLENPHIPNAAQGLVEIREEHGWDEDNPTYRREYLAEWCEDPGVLVYPFDLERNGVDALPTHNERGLPVTPDKWRYVVITDPASVGTTAFAVMAAHPDVRYRYVLRTESHQAMTIDMFAARVRQLLGEYPRAPLIADVDGVGSVHAQELTRKFAIPVIPAEKRERASAVRIAHDEVMTGMIKVLNGEQCDGLRAQWATLPWNDDKDDHAPGYPDHEADCVLYGNRYLKHYTQEEPKPGPEPGSEEWLEREQERMFQAQIKRVQARKQKRRWM